MITNLNTIVESIIPDFTEYPSTKELRQIAKKLGEMVESKLTYVTCVNIPVLFESFIRHNPIFGESIDLVSSNGRIFNMIRNNDPELYRFLNQLKSIYTESLRLESSGVI